MRYGKLFFVFFIFINTFSIFSQNSLEQGFPKLMYVTSREGLREHSAPSIRGNITETFLYGEMVQVFSRQSTSVTIDGVTDYWYSTRYSDNSNRWVFGGYLSEELPNDLPVIIGMWDFIEANNMEILFQNDYFFRFGYKETSQAVSGTWRINGNRITVNLVKHPSPWENVEEVEYETINIQLNVIDKNNIELTFSRGMYGFNFVRLRRNRTGW
jgi:hypothetical protein